MTKNVVDIGKLSMSALKELINKPVEQVVSIAKDGQGWKTVVEALERRAVPNSQDLLGRYEMKFTGGGQLLNYRQIILRHRTDLVKEEKNG